MVYGGWDYTINHKPSTRLGQQQDEHANGRSDPGE
jgi:hypothetical protein